MAIRSAASTHSFVEMHMLRWMCAVTRLDKIRNEHIPEKVGVASRWLGYVQKQPVNALVRCSNTKGVKDHCETRRGRGRLKKTWWNTCKIDMSTSMLM